MEWLNEAVLVARWLAVGFLGYGAYLCLTAGMSKTAFVPRAFVIGRRRIAGAGACIALMAAVLAWQPPTVAAARSEPAAVPLAVAVSYPAPTVPAGGDGEFVVHEYH